MRKCVDCGKDFKSYLSSIRCDKCYQKVSLQEQLDNIDTEDEDTSSDQVVICPYCKASFEPVNEDTYRECFEDGCHDVVCDNCGKTFELVTEVSFWWETFRKE